MPVRLNYAQELVFKTSCKKPQWIFDIRVSLVNPFVRLGVAVAGNGVDMEAWLESIKEMDALRGQLPPTGLAKRGV